MDMEDVQEKGVIKRGSIELTARDNDVLCIYADRSGISSAEPGFPYNEKRVPGLESMLDNLFN